MRNATRKSLTVSIAGLCFASSVAFAGFTLVDDRAKAPAPTTAQDAVPSDDGRVAVLEAELAAARQELALTKAKLDETRARASRTREALQAQIDHLDQLVPINVQFGFGQTAFKPARELECEIITRAVRASAIDITGYTDGMGSQQINEQVALKRAQAAKQYLVDRGIEDAKISAGQRAGTFVADNGTEAGRSANRRVEIAFDRGEQVTDAR